MSFGILSVVGVCENPEKEAKNNMKRDV